MEQSKLLFNEVYESLESLLFLRSEPGLPGLDTATPVTAIKQ